MKSTGRLRPQTSPAGWCNEKWLLHVSLLSCGLLKNGAVFFSLPLKNWGLWIGEHINISTYQHLNISIIGFGGVCWVCYPILGHLWHPKWRRHGRRAYLTSRRLDDSPGAAFGGTGWLSCYRDGNDIGDSQKDQEWWIQPADMVNCYISIYIYT